jgi:hypothetical protein
MSIEDIIAIENEVLLKYEEGRIGKDTARTIKQNLIAERKNKWSNKPLHGQYLKLLEGGTDKEKTFNWLFKGSINIEMEGMVTAAQDQAIQTACIASRYYNRPNSDMCRVCGEHPETVMHILAECPGLAPTEYIRRHNEVAKYIHWRILKDHGFEVCDERKNWSPSPVSENSEVKVLWDFNIYTDQRISARRPDIVVLNKNSQRGLIIDVNCPNDGHVCRNEMTKTMKYADLKIELERIWGMHFQVIPIVIGCLGAVSRKLPYHLQTVGLRSEELDILQKITLAESCGTLRKYITQSPLETEQF